MTLFSDAFVSKQKARWASQKKSDWPLLTKISLLDYRADDREKIESYIAALHPDDQKKIAAQLGNERLFVFAYGELIVANFMIHAGLQPRYEPRIETDSGYVTPDWYVGGETPLICDVFTAGLERARDADEPHFGRWRAE